MTQLTQRGYMLQVMQNMMPVIRETVAQAATSTTEAEADCPLACVEEDIATDISFTLVSEESRAVNEPSRKVVTVPGEGIKTAHQL